MTASLDDAPTRQVGFTATVTHAMASSMFLAWAIGALGPLIIDDLALSAAAFGGITTMMFALAVAFSPLAGWLVDVWGGRTLLHLLFALSALGILLVAGALTYGMVLLGAAITGVAIAINNPATNKLIAEHVHLRRGLIVGVKQSGVQIGAFVAGSVLPAGALAAGWRPVLGICAIIVFLGSVATAVSIPRHERRSPATDAPVPGAQSAPGEPFGATVLWLGLHGLLMGAGVAVTGAYLPLYAHQGLGMSIAKAGLVAAAAAFIGVVARIVWGRIGDQASTIVGLLTIVAVISVVSQLLITVAALPNPAAGQALLWLGAIGIGMSAYAWNAVGMLAIIKVLNVRHAGKASGFVLIGFYAGFVVAPIAFGYILDATGRYTPGWLLVTVCYTGAAVLSESWRRTQRRRHASGPSMPDSRVETFRPQNDYYR